MREKRQVDGSGSVRRTLALGCALLVGALAPLPAFAWSVPGTAASASAPMIGSSWSDADSAANVPFMGVGDQLGLEIHQFSQSSLPSSPWMSPEVLHWAQMMAVMAATAAAIASAVQKKGSEGSPWDHFLGGLVTPPGNAVAPTPTPEPRSLWLFALSALLLGTAYGRRRSRATAVAPGSRSER